MKIGCLTAGFRLPFPIRYRSVLFWLLGLSILPLIVRSQTAPLRRTVLMNGVRVLVKPEPDSDIVAVSVFVRLETPASLQEAAVGEMVAHALFYGNVNRTQNGILTLVNQVGGGIDVLTTPQYVCINCVTVPTQLPEALHLLCDCLKNAEFTPDSLQRARQAILDERRKRRTDAFTTGYDASCDMLGRLTPDVDTLRRVTGAQAQIYFRAAYVPERTVLSVAGQCSAAEVEAAANAFLAGYERHGRALPAFGEPSPPLPVNPSVLALSAPGASACAIVALPAPPVSDVDYPAFTVLQAVLGGGHAARLFRQIRDTRGVGYGIGAVHQADRGEPLIAYLQWSPDRTMPSPKQPHAKQTPAMPTETTFLPDDAVKLLQRQLDDLVAHPPTEDEIQRARNVAIGRDALRHERARDRAFFLGWYETLGLGAGYDADFPKRLGNVSREDVLRVAKTYLRTRATVLVLPDAP